MNVNKISLRYAVLEEIQGQNTAWKEGIKEWCSSSCLVESSLAAVSCSGLESEVKQSSYFGSVSPVCFSDESLGLDS